MDATATVLRRSTCAPLQQANGSGSPGPSSSARSPTAELSVADIVLDCPWEAESMAIADLLMSQHRWGRTRCRRFLSSIPMSETKTVGSMTERQRARAGRAPASPPTWRERIACSRDWPAALRPARAAGFSGAARAGSPARVAISTTCPSGSRR